MPWRSHYGVPHRTVNLRHNISAESDLRCLQFFWSTCVQLWVFRKSLFGPNPLHLVGFDQKQTRFKYVHAQPTLARRGAM